MKYKRYWVAVGEHLGSHYRAFKKLSDAQNYYDKSGARFNAELVIEAKALDEALALLKEMSWMVSEHYENLTVLENRLDDKIYDFLKSIEGEGR